MYPSGSEEALRHAAGTALAALASAPGASGLHVAHAWLGELLIYLSRAVRPYEAVQVQELGLMRFGRGLVTALMSGSGPRSRSGAGSLLSQCTHLQTPHVLSVGCPIHLVARSPLAAVKPCGRCQALAPLSGRATNRVALG